MRGDVCLKRRLENKLFFEETCQNALLLVYLYMENVCEFKIKIHTCLLSTYKYADLV